MFIRGELDDKRLDEGQPLDSYWGWRIKTDIKEWDAPMKQATSGLGEMAIIVVLETLILPQHSRCVVLWRVA
jgi:hypothetical protein